MPLAVVDLLEELAQLGDASPAPSASRRSCSPRPFAAQPECASRIWPTFIRDGTPSGFSTMSTGVPSAMYGMSSTGTIFEIDALVAVAAGHLVARLQAALHRDVHLDHLLHARRQLVALRELLLLLLERAVELDALLRERLLQLLRAGALASSFAEADVEPVVALDAVQVLLGDLGALGELLRAAVRDLADQQALEALERVVLDDAQLVVRGPCGSASARRR